MTLTDLTQGQTPAQQIADLIKQARPGPAAITDKKEQYSRLTLAKKQYLVSGHDVFDTALRPDKQIKDSEGNVTPQAVNRVGVPLQEVIVDRHVAVLFGNAVTLQTEGELTETQTGIVAAVKKIEARNKIDTHNRRMATELGRAMEIAEIWYVTKGPTHNRYGFSTPLTVRVVGLSAWDGNTFYPQFDALGDLIAFSRGHEVVDGAEKKTEYFETYTDEQITRWKKESGGDWQLVEQIENELKKIPVAYASQPYPDWHGVQSSVSRLEKLKSNFAEAIDYHSAPKMVVTGQITKMLSKAEVGGLLEVTPGGKVELLTWDHAPEAVRLEMETHERDACFYTQTPNLTPDAIKGLSDISGVAMKLLFFDAHLKVKKRQEIWDAYLQRRVNLLKTFVGVLHKDWESEADQLDITPVITPFMPANEKELIELLTAANAGQALLSQKTAVGLSGLVEDPEAEYKQLQDEETARSLTSVTEPAL